MTFVTPAMRLGNPAKRMRLATLLATADERNVKTKTHPVPVTANKLVEVYS